MHGTRGQALEVHNRLASTEHYRRLIASQESADREVQTAQHLLTAGTGQKVEPDQSSGAFANTRQASARREAPTALTHPRKAVQAHRQVVPGRHAGEARQEPGAQAAHVADEREQAQRDAQA